MTTKIDPNKNAVVPHVPAADPTSDEALLALPVSYGDTPDMPVEVAVVEYGSLYRAAKAQAPAFAKVGIKAAQIDTMGRFAKRLAETEKNWQKARAGVTLSAGERKLLAEGEALDGKLVAGGRWACRDDAEAQKELSRIAEGSGLTDTVNDLNDLVAFWGAHKEERKNTDITDQDLERATKLAEQLQPAAEKEANNLGAAAALDVRNRCFWAGDELAKLIREAGRYAFRLQPKIASKFASRYRTSAVRRAKKKASEKKKVPPGVPAAVKTAGG